MKGTLSEVLERITPTKEEHAAEKKLAKDVIDFLDGFGVKPILVGSLAKGTDLRGDKDLDVFIMFPEDVAREKLEKEGLRLGKKVFKKFGGSFEVDYSEHPYTKGDVRGYRLEVVPCYAGARIMSSVDRTPFHTRYVKRRIREKPQLAGDIRLLKQFMKGVGVYGAEAKVEGFSGYLAEVLTIHYGSFKKTLDSAAKWSMGEALDPEKHWENEESLKYFFTKANLIVVDPVDRDRNMAAAVSKQSLAKFIVAAQKFTQKPGTEYFFPKLKKPRTASNLAESLKKRGTRILGIEFTHDKINENTLYSQLRKTMKSVRDEIEGFGFKVFKSGFWTNEKDASIILFELEVFALPAVKHHPGPPVDSRKENIDEFTRKYKKEGAYIKDGRWVVDTQRRYKKIEGLAPEIIKSRHGFGKNLRTLEARILYDKKILTIKDEEYRKFLDEFL